jgi:hypothetical protein
MGENVENQQERVIKKKLKSKPDLDLISEILIVLL